MQRWQWGPDGLNVAAVSAKRSGLGQTVGVIDLAFQTDHEDLHEGIADSYRVVGDEESRAGVWGYYHPWEHGTFCAGLVAARRNGPGVVGVAPNARLVLVGLDMLSQPRLAWALKLCLQSQVQVISCSLKPCTSEDSGAGSCQDWMAVGTVLEKALGEVAQARSGKGVCLFWATNDAGTDVANDPIARREEIFAIGCLDQEHSHAGATGEKVYLAPGHNLRSTVARPGGGTYETHEGRHTSYATPCAAGVAALLLEQDSTRSVAEIHRILRSSCRKVEGSNSRGAIDAAIALKGSASAFLDPTGQ
jgi:thermitase